MSEGESVNHALVRMLEAALAGAKAGAFIGGAIVTVDKAGQFTHSANVGRFDKYTAMIAGTAELQFDLIATKKGAQQAHASALLSAKNLIQRQQ